jgi:hypothetical protein
MLPGGGRHGEMLLLCKLGIVRTLDLLRTCDSQKRWRVEAVLRLAGRTGVTRAHNC